MTPLQNVEAYLTSTRGGRQTAGVYFERGEVIHLHLGAPRALPMILQLVSVKGEVSLETTLRVTQTQSPNTHPAMNGLGLEASYQIPTERLKLGAYLLHLALPNKQLLYTMIFFVGDREVPARIMYIYPSHTVNAYSFTHGLNCYSKSATGDLLLQSASFHRTQNGKPINTHVLPGLEWLETLEEPVRYLSDAEADSACFYEGIELIVLGGHSEYWTRAARELFDQAISSGARALVLSGNTMWWQVRTPHEGDHQQLEIYRSEEADPMAKDHPNLATTLWNKLNYSPIESIGADFNHGGYPIARKLKIPGYKQDYLFLPTGNSVFNDMLGDLTLPLGNAVEFDGMPIKGFSGNILLPDYRYLNAYCANILGYMPGYRAGFTIGTTHYYQKTEKHGGVFQVGAISAFSTPLRANRKYPEMLTFATLALLDKQTDIFLPKQDWKITTPYRTPSEMISLQIKDSIQSTLV